MAKLLKKAMNLSPPKDKGRAMLRWYNKHPLEKVSAYPAQLIETWKIKKAANEPNYETFAKGANLLLHGDNKEVLSSLLVNGFRSKIDLIYIDPPFDSAADYVKKVQLRGKKEKMQGEEVSVIEKTQYEDMWADSSYLQFMYERLILLRELLSDNGSIYLHCDPHKSHHLRFLLDEVFGADNFCNEIIWKMPSASGYKTLAEKWVRGHDTIFYYTRGSPVFKKMHLPYSDEYISSRKSKGKSIGKGIRISDTWNDNTLWDDIHSLQTQGVSAKEGTGYPTQKPVPLIERIIQASSNEGDLVLDCFCGSGATARAAAKLNRRWIMADINKGAVQLTIQEIQKLNKLKKQIDGVAHYRINNYDFAEENELRDAIFSRYGIDRDRKIDTFFDGSRGGRLVKIVALNKPLTKLEIQMVKDELKNNRADEDRDIEIFCNGVEHGLIEQTEQENKTKAVAKLIVINILADGIHKHRSPEIEWKVKRKGKTADIKITDFISHLILQRLQEDETISNDEITDFRQQIDAVYIDNNYNGKHFQITKSDVPEKKENLVVGEYSIECPAPHSRIAIKVVDILGEEVIATDDSKRRGDKRPRGI